MSRTRIRKRIEDLERKDSPRAYVWELVFWEGEKLPPELAAEDENHGRRLFYASEEDYQKMKRKGQVKEEWESMPADEARRLVDDNERLWEEWMQQRVREWKRERASQEGVDNAK